MRLRKVQRSEGDEDAKAEEEEQEEGGLGEQVDVGEYSTPWASAMAAHGPTDCELEILIGILCQWTMPTRPPNQAAQPPPRLDPALLLLLTNRCEIVDEFSRIRLIRFLIFVAAAGKRRSRGRRKRRSVG